MDHETRDRTSSPEWGERDDGEEFRKVGGNLPEVDDISRLIKCGQMTCNAFRGRDFDESNYNTYFVCYISIIETELLTEMDYNFLNGNCVEI